MPRHQPRHPPRRVPTTPPNPAVAALGVGISPDKWTPAGIIHALTNRYLQLVKIADDAKEQADTRRQRLSMAGAFELAQVIALYHQDRGETELFARWERRSKQASSLAYRTTNPVARMLGADGPPEESHDEPT